MISNFLMRLFVCLLVALAVLGYDSYSFLDANRTWVFLHTEEPSLDNFSLKDAGLNVFNQRDNILYYYYDFNRLPVESYENIEYQSDAGMYVCVDEKGELSLGNCTADSGPPFQVISEKFPKVLLQNSFLLRFYILHLLVLLLLLGFLKDLFSAFKDRSASAAASPKARQKQAQALLKNLQSLSAKGKHDKVLELLAKPENKNLLGKEMEKTGLIAGRAYIATGDAENGLQYLRKYARNFKEDDEAALEVGNYLAEHPKDARLQDLPFLLVRLESDPDDLDFMKFMSDFCLKNKVSDKNSIRGLIQICATEAGSKELTDYVMEFLTQYESTDELAMSFFENLKKKEPENPRPVLMLAEGKMAAGKFDEALDELEELLNLDYENQRVHDLLLKVYQIKEQVNDLYDIYNKILEQLPGNEIAQAQQRKIQSDPSFNQELASSRQNLTLEQLLALRKSGDASVEADIMKKYERTLTIMFTDIKGYTSMTESQSPLETMQILQESDEILPPLIKKHEGTLIKKIGDAFMARFDSADSAIMAGIQIQQMIHRNNKRREEAGKIAWRIRIGLNTGKVMVKDGDVYGDAVNVAARVESSSEADHVFCTQETKEAVVNKKIQFEAKDLKKVKGKAEAIQLYSVVFDPAGK
jgi:class 3 adenylate cyclase